MANTSPPSTITVELSLDAYDYLSAIVHQHRPDDHQRSARSRLLSSLLIASRELDV